MQDARSSRPHPRFPWIDWTGILLLLAVALASIVLPVLGSGPARTPGMPAQLMTWDTTVVFGPQIFDSPTGSNTQHVEEFSIDLLPGARYILRVENGDSVGDHRPTFADVLVNGFRYIRADSLSGQSVVHKLIEPLDSTRLLVVVGGSAGDFLEISLIEEPDPGFLVFGPETFLRLAEPAVVTDTFVLPAAALAPWRLHLINGDGEGTNKADSAWIRINGTNVVTRSDFNANTHAFAKDVILADTNIVQTRVKGPTSSYVTVRMLATDSTPPLLTVEHPDSNAVISDTLAAVGGSVVDETPVRVFVNNTEATIDSLGEFSIIVPLLVEGPDTIDIIALNSAGFTTTERRSIIRDTSTPALTVLTPDNGTVTAEDSITVSGEVADASNTSVEVNAIPFTVQMDGSFTGKVPLDPGTNLILVVATDAGMNQHQVPRTVIRDNDAPVLVVITPEDEATIEDPVVLVSGTVHDSTTVTVTGNGLGLLVQDDTLFSGNVTLPEGNVLLVVRATDAAGNFTEDTLSLTVEGVPIPPDPASVAPPLDPTVATTVFAATQFLYTGPDSIQRGVAPGTIEPTRAAVVRGRVLDREGDPLSGVKVFFPNGSGYGYTYTRADGGYDLVVNGGGPMTVEFTKASWLPAQRTTRVPWQDFVVLDDVRLVQLDTAATMIDLTDTAAIQVARGSVMQDADGPRQATLFFREGTIAEAVLPNGSVDTLTSITVRVTEYTVGDDGLETMPAALPPTSAYTYAVEFTVDEARAAGAKQVRFNQPVVVYVENFLEFPTGTRVPTAFYDFEVSAWLPVPDGRVIEITAINGGVADIDINGDGNADSAGELASIGITVEERAQLAQLYSAGVRLWRVETTHFSPCDMNVPLWSNIMQHALDVREPQDCTNKVFNSIIECENQILGEEMGVVGTAFTLNYRSSRSAGYVDGRSFTVPLIGDTVPSGLIRIELTVDIAGRHFNQAFSPDTNQSLTFTWDGLDAYGRPMRGEQPALVVLDYIYERLYAVPDTIVASGQFALSCRGSAGAGWSVCILTDTAAASTPRREYRVGNGRLIRLGNWNASEYGLGGWTLDAHHAYNPISRVLHYGNGSRRSFALDQPIVTNLGGTSGGGYTGDGGQASSASFDDPQGLAIAPDGSIYVADTDNDRVRRIAPDGVVTTVAGTGTEGFSGDGGPATAAQLTQPVSVAITPDGGFLIGDGVRLRRVDASGTITTIAGNGTFGLSGDGGPADSAASRGFYRLRVAPDGTIYFVDGSVFTLNVVRRIGPDGIINRVVDNVTCDSVCGDGGPALQAGFFNMPGLALASDGSLYISDGNHVFRQVDPAGRITRVAGVYGEFGFNGEGIAADSAWLDTPAGVVVTREGSIYVADASRIRQISTDRMIATAVGGIAPCLTPDLPSCHVDEVGPVFRLAGASDTWDIVEGHDGSIYFTDRHQIRRLAPRANAFGVSEHRIASESGLQLFVFDSAGRHVETRNTLTGSIVHRFRYDLAGRLIEIEDADSLITTVHRNGSGVPTSIEGPFGHQTLLTVDSIGQLIRVVNPASDTIQMTYQNGGLLAGLEDARGNLKSYAYDALARLERDEDADSGFIDLTPTYGSRSVSVALTTAENRTSHYKVETPADGSVRYTQTGTDGLLTRTITTAADSTHSMAPDSTVSTSVRRADPRFGVQSPFTKSQSIALPSGLTQNVTAARHVTLSDPSDPLSLLTQTDTVRLNSRVYKSVFTKSTGTFSYATPANRQMTERIDSLGRVTFQLVPGIDSVTYAYNALGQLTQVSQGNRTWQYGYDGSGRLATIEDPLARTDSLYYDAADRLTRQVLPDGEEITYDYDRNGNLVSLTPPGRPAHTFGYTAVDLMADYTAPDIGGDSTATRYTWNLDRQLTRIARPDGRNVDIGYDAAGRPDSIGFSRGGLFFTYSGTTGQLTGLTAPGSNTLAYSYDGALLTRVEWDGEVEGSVEVGYDSDFRVVKQKVNDTDSVSFQYDNDGLLTGAGSLTLTRSSTNGLLTGTTLGSVTTSLGYNGFGELSSYTASYSSSPLFQTAYTRDNLGRITRIIETVQSVTDTIDYAYDQVGRLEEVQRNGVIVESYTYDANGNRTSFTGTSGTINATYDDQDRLLTYGSASYTYTAAGELSEKVIGTDTTRYEYDELGNLVEVELPDGTLIEYVIDGQNRRIGKKEDGALVQAFVYGDQLNPVAELDSLGNIVARFVYGERINVPEYVVKSGVTYRIVADHLGSVRLVVNDGTGQVVQRIDYDAFGQVMQNSSLDFQPFAFVGGLLETSSGLTRFGARDYDAISGRWTTQDPLRFGGGSSNLWGYALEDPVNFSDPFGLQAIWDLLDLIEFARSFRDFLCNPTWRTAAWATLDLAGLLPIVPSTGAVRRLGRWPRNAEEMDDYLGFPGRRIPDPPGKEGRGKVEWKPNGKAKIVFEQHPYHPDGPDWHSGPHWHYTDPWNNHIRFRVGDPIPGLKR